MSALLVVCHNPNCRDSVEVKPQDPRPMVRMGETFSCWTFKCQTCGAQRAVTKDVIGGTVGQGRTDEQRGKGLKRFTPGGSFS